MIKETINFKPSFPINISINGINEYPKHWHNELEIICVLDGSVRIQDSCFSCCLTEGDIYIFNGEDLHSIHRISKTNIILSLHIDLIYFSKFFHSLNKMIFNCDSYIKKNEIADELSHLRFLISKILIELNASHDGYNDNIEYYMKNFISFLIDNFQYFCYEMNLTNHINFKSQKKYKMGKEQMERIHRICDYIYKHHSEKISLKDIAKLEYLSIHYLSHHIKDTCGLNFQELLSLARVEAAEKLLIDTDKKMDIIAVESGFSSRKYLNYHFKKWYKCTPSEYRKKNSNADNLKRKNKFLGYNKEIAYEKINGYLYGANQNDMPFNSSTTSHKSLGKLANLLESKSKVLSSEYHTLIYNLTTLLENECTDKIKKLNDFFETIK